MSVAFSGKRTLITGASSGIGRALAIELARNGASLCITGRHESRLEQTRRDCVSAGSPAVHAIIADVSRAAECETLVKSAVEKLGGLDLLINNAGGLVWGPFSELEDPTWITRQMETNYLSVAHITFHALPHLLQSRGHLAAVSSVSGLFGITGQTLYSAAKHAVHGLMDSLRIELKGTGVAVTLIAPDLVSTNVLASAITPKGARFGQRFVPSAYQSPEDCAKVIVRGLARRKRLVLTSARSRFALFARLVLPGLVDWIGARASATLKLEPHAAD